MPDAAKKTAERPHEAQRAATSPAQAPEESVEPSVVPRSLVAGGGAAGEAADTAARHAEALRDPRLHEVGALGRARMIQQLQRGYGNGHVERVLARVQASQGTEAPLRRRESGGESTAEDRPPTEAEKAAALKAAAAAEHVATQANTRGADQAGQAQAGKAAEQALGQAARQKAVAASGAATAAAQAGKDARRGGGAGAAAGKAKHVAAPQVAQAAGGADGKAPASPEQDPTFQAVVARVKGVGAKQQAHPAASTEAAAAQAAAESPASELSSKAQANQVGKMQQAEAPPFDAAGFRAKLKEKIAALAPKNAQEADSFKESDRLGGVKGEMQGDVAQEQAMSQGPIAQQAAAEPDSSGVAPKPVTPLAPAAAGAPPAGVGAEGAAPKPRTAAEVEAPITEHTGQIDQQMASADVSEEQLRQGNEPEFQAALDARGQAQEQARSGPQEYRQAEQAQIRQAEGEAAGAAEQRTQSMHGDRAALLQQVGGKQTQAKSKDEQERARVGADIQSIYNETRASVEATLGGLDARVNQAFDQGAGAAKKTFEDYVEAKMSAFKEKRYGGWLGWARWAKDKIAGMPGEVNAFYSEGRSLYLREMDAVIDRVVAIVGATITEARAEVARGKQRIAEYVATLPASLKQVGQQAADDIQGQFDSLEESVTNKQGELIDSLAKKYQENLQAIDARIEELKAANKGLVDKAIDAVAGVIKTIMQLKDMLLGVLARAAGVIGTIIKNPIGFLSNLIGGVKQGLMNFVSNIGTHLRKGLLAWLFGELAAGGIQIPASFDLKGILTLVMQILGLTWEAIKAQAVKILGPRVVSVLEGAFEIFMVIKDQGIGGLWEYIKDQLGNLKDMVLDGIKDLVITQVIQAGIQWLLGILGGPAGAFIKAAKAIIDIVMWFVNNGSRVMALVNSVLDSVAAIASGSLGQAAAAIERSLANVIPIVLGFLASLLGLGNLSQKIKGVIEKVQQPVKKAVGWVLGKAKAFAAKVMGKVKGAVGGKPRSEAEKQKALQAGLKAGKSAVERYKGKSVGEAILKPLLSATKLRYRLSVLQPVKLDTYWGVEGDVQRTTKLQTEVEIGGGRPSEAEITAAVAAATGARATAVGELTKQGLEKKTVACGNGKCFVSGWGDEEAYLATVTQLFEAGKEKERFISVEEQIQAEEERKKTGKRTRIEGLPYDPRRAGAMDQQIGAGAYSASHAEKQAAIMTGSQSIGVSRAMCGDCQNYFKALAQSTKKMYVVADPGVVRVFLPDGTVETR